MEIAKALKNSSSVMPSPARIFPIDDNSSKSALSWFKKICFHGSRRVSICCLTFDKTRSRSLVILFLSCSGKSSGSGKLTIV